MPFTSLPFCYVRQKGYFSFSGEILCGTKFTAHSGFKEHGFQSSKCTSCWGAQKHFFVKPFSPVTWKIWSELLDVFTFKKTKAKPSVVNADRLYLSLIADQAVLLGNMLRWMLIAWLYRMTVQKPNCSLNTVNIKCGCEGSCCYLLLISNLPTGRLPFKKHLSPITLLFQL